jgi:hypothetical protein
VAVAVADRHGQTVGYLRGLFSVSPEALASLERRVGRAAFAVAVVVLLSGAVLYPLVRGLTSRLGQLSAQLLDANLETLKVLGSADAIRALIKGAFLHDVGKIGVRDQILLKPGRLDSVEFEEMKQHVDHGLDIVRRSQWLADCEAVVGHHHEEYDGSGYAAGLRMETIPLLARIFAIVDVFDALTSERPYKPPMGLEEALAILREGAGNHFDPRLLAALEGLAPSLYAAFANRAREPREAVEGIVERYFRGDIGALMGQTA